MIYILTRDWNGAAEGTRLWPQSGMYYYKTITEMDRWLEVEFVTSNPDLFRQITAHELLFNFKMVEK